MGRSNNARRGAGAVIVTLTLGACAAPLTHQRGAPPHAISPAVPVEYRPSPNYNERRPSYVILHHTSSDTAERALATLTSAPRKVSAHYLIGRDGRVYYLVDERHRAWHAGEAYWGGTTDVNSASIGIELDNNGREPFAEPQIAALLALLADLKARYKLPASAFLGHADVAPGRKVDPSARFPWRRLAQEGFGLWCDPPYPAVPASIDNVLLLQAFGYNVWNADAAVASFKLRYTPDDPSPQMTEKDRSVLYCLVQQMQSLAIQE